MIFEVIAFIVFLWLIFVLVRIQKTPFCVCQGKNCNNDDNAAFQCFA